RRTTVSDRGARSVLIGPDRGCALHRDLDGHQSLARDCAHVRALEEPDETGRQPRPPPSPDCAQPYFPCGVRRLHSGCLLRAPTKLGHVLLAPADPAEHAAEPAAAQEAGPADRAALRLNMTGDQAEPVWAARRRLGRRRGAGFGSSTASPQSQTVSSSASGCGTSL